MNPPPPLRRYQLQPFAAILAAAGRRVVLDTGDPGDPANIVITAVHT